MTSTTDGLQQSSLRELVVRFAKLMLTSGLVKGTSGNLSARLPAAEGYLVTPSGVDYSAMTPAQVVQTDVSGHPSEGMKPSVDTPIHVAIYQARPDVGAVIHTHSPYAAAFSTLKLEIPPLITESAGYLGGAVRVIDYVPPAQADTGEAVAAGLGSERAILLPNHGVIAVGENLAKAYAAATQVEESAHVAFIALQLGAPQPVSAGEINRMHDFIHHKYGQR